jgi:riboflavin kinase/FMN adenylyltransferase
VLLERCQMRELVIGHDHGFGRGRSGDVETLRRLGAERGFDVDVVEVVDVGDQRLQLAHPARRRGRRPRHRRADARPPYQVSGRVGERASGPADRRADDQLADIRPEACLPTGCTR